MSGLRLPLIGERPQPAVPRGARPAAAQRAVAPRPFVTVAGADADASLAPGPLRCAQDLLRALAAEGRPALVLATAGETRPDQLEALREAGATAVIAIEGPEEQLTQRALAALEPLPRDALALGVGSALARVLQPVLSIRVAHPHAFDGGADIELPRDSALVAAAIAARLAR